MVEQKFIYDRPVLELLRYYQSHFKDKGIEVDTRFIDLHGDFCPRCGDDFKVYNRTVKGVASLSAFIILEQNKAVVYCVCKKCAKELSRVRFGQVEGDTKVTEERIFERIPDLRRSNMDYVTEGEVKKQIEIFKGF